MKPAFRTTKTTHLCRWVVFLSPHLTEPRKKSRGQKRKTPLISWKSEVKSKQQQLSLLFT